MNLRNCQLWEIMWLLGFIRHMINDNSFRIRSSRAVLVRGQVQFSHFLRFSRAQTPWCIRIDINDNDHIGWYRASRILKPHNRSRSGHFYIMSQGLSIGRSLYKDMAREGTRIHFWNFDYWRERENLLWKHL